MRRAKTVFRKELLDTLRDRRTLIMMIVVPLFAIPALMAIAVKVSRRQEQKAEAKTLKVAFLGAEHAPGLRDRFAADSQFTVIDTVPGERIEERIRAEAIDGAVSVPPSFFDQVSADGQARIIIHFRSSESFNVTERRLREVIEAYDSSLVAGRVARLRLDPKLFDAIAIDPVDIATAKEVIGKAIGGFLPYIFVLMCFMGALYPGIDLGAGEKERGTLETLLTSPASRLEIVVGKFLVVTLVGFASAMISILGLYLGVRSVGEIPQELLAVIREILSFKVVVTVLTLLVPLAGFFAALILAVSIAAKSFKEAQSALAPLNFVIIVPVFLGLLPGIELSPTTALIPILNVSLATKDLIAGTIEPVNLALTYLSLLALAGVSIWFCARRFEQEETLFRA